MFTPTYSTDLPMPPRDILQTFYVSEPSDTRFRSCARLLQSIWRQRRKLEKGTYVSSRMGPTPLGSRLADAPARAGFNFLTPDIAKLVRRELAYRERGALIEEERAWSNLLSSSALVFNLLGPLKLDLALAKKVLKPLIPLDVKQVTGLYFETSPGRGDDRYIGDKTAFDALITYLASDGSAGFVAIEVKYAESQPTVATPPTQRLQDVAERSELYSDPSAPELFRPALRQLTAEHCLATTLVGEPGPFQQGAFVVISPVHNDEMSACISDYRKRLSSEPHTVPMKHVTLEELVKGIGAAG